MAKKILLTLLVLGAVTSTVGAGTFATFTATTTNPANTFSSGTLTMNTDHPTASFITLTNMIPGDTVSAFLTVQNTGTEDITTYALSTTVTSSSSLLDSDTTNG